MGGVAGGLAPALVVVLAVGGCTPSSRVSPSGGAAHGGAPREGSAADIQPKRVVSPPGSALVDTCMPTGAEQCFNAADDNCNGVIDEGCGLGTGPLQFMVAWGDSPADVDLQVLEPDGVRVSDRHRSAADGLRLDRDCPGEGCYQQNVENVFLDAETPRPGRYEVEVKLTALHGADVPVNVRLGARVGIRTFLADVTLTAPEESRVFVFDL